MRAYTSGSAYARFSEDLLGTLEEGKEADLAVLSQDIFSIASGDLSKTRVVMTMVGGEVVFNEMQRQFYGCVRLGGRREPGV